MTNDTTDPQADRGERVDEQLLAKRPRLAVFGGSFDPVHVGHLYLAGAIVRRGYAEEVLFVPARLPPHKLGRSLASPEHRLAMLRIALEPYSEFSVSDIELQRDEGPSYSFDTLDTLTRVFPEHEIRFLMGMDNLVDLHQWYRATELVQRYQFLIYPRLGVKSPSFATLSGHFGGRNARRLLDSMVDLPLIPVVATEIREDLAAGRNVAGRCLESIRDYIRTNKLYRPRTGN